MIVLFIYEKAAINSKGCMLFIKSNSKNLPFENSRYFCFVKLLLLLSIIKVLNKAVSDVIPIEISFKLHYISNIDLFMLMFGVNPPKYYYKYN